MRIDKIASSAEYRMDEQLQNLTTFGAKLWFSKLKIFWKFVNFQIWKIFKMFNLGNSNNCRFR